MAIFLNEILGLSDEQIKNAKVRFVMRSSSYKTFSPIDSYVSNQEEAIKDALWQKKYKRFRPGQIAICFVPFERYKDKYLLTFVLNIGKETGINRPAYEYTFFSKLEKFFGRIVVSYHNEVQQNTKKASNVLDQITVSEILQEKYSGDDFPGISKIRCTFAQLKNNIDRHGWKEVLDSLKAVYLITDKGTGKLYVGSAYADGEKLYHRWSNYLSNGTGGNKSFEKLKAEMGKDAYMAYISDNFQFSVLQIFDEYTSDDVIINREHEWMDILDSIKHGYNN